VLSEEGLDQVKPYLAELTEDAMIYIDAQLLPLQTRARKFPLDFKGKGLKRGWSIIALAEVLRRSRLYPLEAFREAIASDERYAQESLQFLDVNMGVSGRPSLSVT
jgi:hypothetical protein